MSSATPPPSVTRPRLAQLRELLDCSAARAVQLLQLAAWDVDRRLGVPYPPPKPKSRVVRALSAKKVKMLPGNIWSATPRKRQNSQKCGPAAQTQNRQQPLWTVDRIRGQLAAVGAPSVDVRSMSGLLGSLNIMYELLT